MDDIFQLLYQSMVIIKEMEQLTDENPYEVYEYMEKQNELNNKLIETLRLMIFKKE